jgi:hypothetical protein
MSKFIETKFPQGIPQTADVASQVHKCQYDLLGPDGDVIAPDFWEELLEPGWTVVMSLWPLHIEAEVRSRHGANATERVPHLPTKAESDPSKTQQKEKDILATELSNPSEEKTADSRSSKMSSPPNMSGNSKSQPEPQASRISNASSAMIRCPFCNIFTGEKEALLLHVNSVHVDTDDLSEGSGSDPENVETPTPDKGLDSGALKSSATAESSSAAKANRSEQTQSTTKPKTTANRSASSKKPKPSGFSRWIAASMGGPAPGSSSKKSKTPAVPVRKRP